MSHAIVKDSFHVQGIICNAIFPLTAHDTYVRPKVHVCEKREYGQLKVKQPFHEPCIFHRPNQRLRLVKQLRYLSVVNPHVVENFEVWRIRYCIRPVIQCIYVKLLEFLNINGAHSHTVKPLLGIKIRMWLLEFCYKLLETTLNHGIYKLEVLKGLRLELCAPVHESGI